jgi:hypothetical protein
MDRVQVPTPYHTRQRRRPLIGRLPELEIELGGHESTPAGELRGWSWRRLPPDVHDVWGNFTLVGHGRTLAVPFKKAGLPLSSPRVLMDEAAQTIAPDHRAGPQLACFGRTVGCPLVKPLVWAGPLIVINIFPKHVIEMGPAKDQQVVPAPPGGRCPPSARRRRSPGLTAPTPITRNRSPSQARCEFGPATV